MCHEPGRTAVAKKGRHSGNQLTSYLLKKSKQLKSETLTMECVISQISGVSECMNGCVCMCCVARCINLKKTKANQNKPNQRLLQAGGRERTECLRGF